MHSSVAAVVRKFLSLYEGEVPEMYLDNRGLVTTGVGNLLHNAKEASRYSWEDGNGNGVDAPVVEAEYRRIASDDTKQKIPQWKIMGGGNFIKEAKRLGVITLRLTSISYTKIFTDKLAGLEATMKDTPGYEDYETFPADAQLGILSVIWANGAGANHWGPRKDQDLRLHKTWPKFTGAVQQRAWLEIAEREYYKWRNIRDDRKRATGQVFRNAQLTEDALQSDPDTDTTLIRFPIP